MTVSWPPRYPDGQRVRPNDLVLWRGELYRVLALWIDRDDNTDVSLDTLSTADGPPPRLRAKSSELYRPDAVLDNGAVIDFKTYPARR